MHQRAHNWSRKGGGDWQGCKALVAHPLNLCLPSMFYSQVQVDLEKAEESPLMELDDTQGSEHTVFIMPPEEPTGPDGAELPPCYK